MKILAATGWLAAAGAGVVAYGEFATFASQKQAALDQQAAAYEQKLTQLKADAEAAKTNAAAALKKTQDEALANQASIQAELDFQRLPELPIDVAFRTGPALFVENKGGDDFKCQVRLTRPSLAQSRNFEFELKARAYKDLGAIGDWVFAKGDKVEFIKSGFKPRVLEAP